MLDQDPEEFKRHIQISLREKKNVHDQIKLKLLNQNSSIRAQNQKKKLKFKRKLSKESNTQDFTPIAALTKMQNSNQDVDTPYYSKLHTPKLSFFRQ